jgi:MFS family permease
LVATILASVIAYIDESVVNVALPVISKDLATSVAVIQWVINAYTLCLAAFLLVGGAAGDQLGRRRVICYRNCNFRHRLRMVRPFSQRDPIDYCPGGTL